MNFQPTSSLIRKPHSVRVIFKMWDSLFYLKNWLDVWEIVRKDSFLSTSLEQLVLASDNVLKNIFMYWIEISKDIFRIKKSVVFNQDNHDFFVKATKFVGNQLRFLTTYELSISIKKSLDFDGFLDEVDFVRLFSEKYKYYFHPTISQKPLRFCHSLSNPCLPSFVHAMLSSSSSFSLSNF